MTNQFQLVENWNQWRMLFTRERLLNYLICEESWWTLKGHTACEYYFYCDVFCRSRSYQIRLVVLKIAVLNELTW